MCSNRSNTIIESYSSNRCIRTIRTSGLNFQRYKRTCNAKGITWLHPVLSWQLMVLTSLLCPYPFLLAGQMFRCLSSLCLCDSFPWRIFLAFLAKKRFRPILSIWKMRSDEMIWFVDMWFKESKTLHMEAAEKDSFDSRSIIEHWMIDPHDEKTTRILWCSPSQYEWQVEVYEDFLKCNVILVTDCHWKFASLRVYIYISIQKSWMLLLLFFKHAAELDLPKTVSFLPHVFPLHLITYRTYYILKQIHTFKDSPTKILPTFFHPPPVYSIL